MVRIVLIMIIAFPVVMQAQWPNYRGDRQLTGTTSETIPDEVELKWVFQTDNEIKTSPVVQDQRIVIGSGDGYLYCLDFNGKLLWKYNTEYAIEGPALIRHQTVYVGNLHGTLHAIDLHSGELIWKFETDNQIMAAPNWWSDGEREYILVGGYDYWLYCLDASSGKEVWKYEAMNYLHAAVAIDGNYALFGGCDGLLHRVDISTGKALSTMEIASYIASTVALDGNYAYIGDYDGNISAVNYNNNTLKWSFESDDRQLPFIAAPVIAGNRVFAGNRDRFVYCLDKANGNLMWRQNVGSRVESSPLADRQNLLVANMRGDLMLLRQGNGDIIWTFELGSSVTGSPAVVNDLIIVGAMDGAVYCLKGI